MTYDLEEELYEINDILVCDCCGKALCKLLDGKYHCTDCEDIER
jgi:hypothetical protein